MKKTTSVLLALALTFTFSTAAYADSKHFIVGGFKKATTIPGINLRWNSTNTAYYQSTYIEPAANSWNGISSQVQLAKATTTTAKITVLTGRTSQYGLWGQMLPFCTNLGILNQGGFCIANKDWTRAEITSYTDQQVDFNFTAAQIRSVIIHELGHALSLLHVEGSNPAASIMKTGLQATYNIRPQTLDKNHLKEKWGN